MRGWPARRGPVLPSFQLFRACSTGKGRKEGRKESNETTLNDTGNADHSGECGTLVGPGYGVMAWELRQEQCAIRLQSHQKF